MIEGGGRAGLFIKHRNVNSGDVYASPSDSSMTYVIHTQRPVSRSPYSSSIPGNTPVLYGYWWNLEESWTDLPPFQMS